MSKKLLEGVKVIELANFIAAATAGRFLADQGATVIKVESAKGDPLRFTAPSEGRPLDWHENTTWELENANKLNISINTKSEEGREALFALLEDADVLINLSLENTPDLPRGCSRVLEIVSPQPDVLHSTRARYRAYRERGLEPQTHTLGS